MAEILEVRELVEYSRKHAQSGRKAYLLEVEGKSFGFLYVTPMSYTVAWPGVINFFNLESEVLWSLSGEISPQGNRVDPQAQYAEKAVVASFIISNDPDKLVEYDLAKSEQYREYQMTLRHAERIAFARYDVHVSWLEPPIEYSFTAENPQLSTDEDNEVAIMLPRSQSGSGRLLDWIIQHHSAKLSFTGIEREASIKRLSEIVRDCSAFSDRHDSSVARHRG